MIIDGVTYDNPNFGYVSEVMFPFTYCDVGDDTVQIFDAGEQYDRHRCRCELVFYDSDAFKTFIEGYTRVQTVGGRSRVLNLSACNSTGFYPFGYFIAEPLAGYDVIMSEVLTEDKQDITGKFWKVSFTLSLINEGLRTFTPLSIVKADGSLTFAGVSGLPYPPDGFKKDKSFDQRLDFMAGGFQFGMDINNGDDDRIDSEFTVILTDAQLNNLMQAIIQNYRGEAIPLTVPDSYSVFGIERSNSAVSRNVKLIDKVLKIKHISHNQFEVVFKITGR